MSEGVTSPEAAIPLQAFQLLESYFSSWTKIDLPSTPFLLYLIIDVIHSYIYRTVLNLFENR